METSVLITSMQVFFSLGSDFRLHSEISIENNCYSSLACYLMQYCSVIVKNLDNRQFTEQKTSGWSSEILFCCFFISYSTRFTMLPRYHVR